MGDFVGTGVLVSVGAVVAVEDAPIAADVVIEGEIVLVGVLVSGGVIDKDSSPKGTEETSIIDVSALGTKSVRSTPLHPTRQINIGIETNLFIPDSLSTHGDQCVRLSDYRLRSELLVVAGVVICRAIGHQGDKDAAVAIHVGNPESASLNPF